MKGTPSRNRGGPRLRLALGFVPGLLIALGLGLLLALPGARGGEDRAAPAGSPEDADLDRVSGLMPSIEDLGYFLGRLPEPDKGRALNVLADLAADSRLPPSEVGPLLKKMIDEGGPPDEFGYKCTTCFQKRLSNLLVPLRLRGPRVNAPREGVIAVPLNDGFLGRMKKESQEEVGGTLPGLVQALMNGYSVSGKFPSGSYVRYHGKGARPESEPAFFTSGEAMQKYEATLTEPLDGWSLAKWLCTAGPRNRFDPGFLLLYFDPNRSCTEVRIPTAADTEDPDFRPTPQTETQSGFTCGGAPEWVCPNVPMAEIVRSRYVPNSSYVEEIR
jgi:hypothetical protein